MTTKFVQTGDIINLTAGSAISSNDVILLPGMIAVAQTAAATGETYAAGISGVYELACKSTDVVAIGDELFWDADNEEMTLTAAGHVYAGLATKASGSGTATVEILINAPRRANTVVVQCTIPDSDEVNPGVAVAPVAGEIIAVYSTVDFVTGGATVAAETVVTTKIGATNITGGAITIASGAAIGDVDTATPTAANVVAAGDKLSAVSDGANTANHPVTVFFVIERR